jgi:hypothetical protein
MPDADPQVDPIARACELVGRFAYHFSRLEEQLNSAIIRLFKLDETTADIITANIDFARKLNIVQSALNEQNASRERERVRKEIKKTFADISTVNMDRQIAAHSAFETHEMGGVQFKRTVARGHLNRMDPHWSEAKFQSEFEKMERLERALESLLRKIKPYVPTFHFLGF